MKPKVTLYPDVKTSVCPGRSVGEICFKYRSGMASSGSSNSLMSATVAASDRPIVSKPS